MDDDATNIVSPVITVKRAERAVVRVTLLDQIAAKTERRHDRMSSDADRHRVPVPGAGPRLVGLLSFAGWHASLRDAVVTRAASAASGRDLLGRDHPKVRARCDSDRCGAPAAGERCRRGGHQWHRHERLGGEVWSNPAASGERKKRTPAQTTLDVPQPRGQLFFGDSRSHRPLISVFTLPDGGGSCIPRPLQGVIRLRDARTGGPPYGDTASISLRRQVHRWREEERREMSGTL